MKHSDFKTHDIQRGTPPYKSQYNDYKPDLEKDFKGRCAYCNLHKDSITTPFEIDHFIPEKTFKLVREDLRLDYKNLVYACKKCNIAKGSQFMGDIHAEIVTNEQFYDPVEVDYNTIFFRNEYGAIDSIDGKGRRMIRDIKLYRPIHILGWLCEQLAYTMDKLNDAIEQEHDDKRKILLEQARDKIANKYFQQERLFKSSYNNPEFAIDGYGEIESTV